jgi:hypothetical protein
LPEAGAARLSVKLPGLPCEVGSGFRTCRIFYPDGLKYLGLTYELLIIIGILLIIIVIFLPRGLVSLPGEFRKRKGS